MAGNIYPEVTVEKILEAARRLFGERLCDNTTIQDIVNELGKPNIGAMRSLIAILFLCQSSY